MVGQAAEQIIAGVVLSERLAVTMYGAIHRAQFNGARNLRGLVIEPKLLAESAFRLALTDATSITALTRLEHANIVPTVAVESGGAEVVVVTRGTGRYVSAQDLIASAKATKSQGGKMSLHVAASIGKAVVEALAAAHAIGVVHGAVHPRSVLIDEDGAVRLGDFVVGRALTTAVAQGADNSLWRGLAGYLAPELVIGEDPTPQADVFAVGAMLFTMLSGEVPPGTLHVSPAVERLVQRALDTDTARRYKSADELLENLLEAFEDDRWELAERGELIKAAGLSAADTNIDDATEDLLASLGSPSGSGSLSNIQVAPARPSMDLRAAEAVVGRSTGAAANKRLDALLEGLEEPSGMTSIEDRPPRRDPISEIIQRDPRRDEAIVQARPTPPSVVAQGYEYGDEATPIPPPMPMRDSDADLRPRTAKPTVQVTRRSSSREVVRNADADADAALDAISGLDEPVRRVSTAADVAESAAARLVDAAARAENAARVIETGKQTRVDSDATEVNPPKRNTPPPRRAVPIVEPVMADVAPLDTNVKSPAGKIIAVLCLLAIAGGGYFLYTRQKQSEEETAAQKQKEKDEQQALEDKAKKLSRDLQEAQADSGSVEISSTPDRAGVWLRIGRTTVTTNVKLKAGTTHEFAIKHDGYDVAQVQVTAASWKADKPGGIDRTATVSATLQQHQDGTGKKPAMDPRELPLQPIELHKDTGLVGEGPVTIESTPKDSEVWQFIGTTTPVARFDELIAGRDYTVAVIKEGYKPKILEIKADDWRDGGDSRAIDVAKKKKVLERSADLEPVDPKKAPR